METRDPGYDWEESLATLEQLVGIARAEAARQGRAIGVYPEIKNAAATNRVLEARGETRRLEELLLEELERLGVQPSDPVLLQNFELSSLEEVAGRSEVRQVFLTKRNLTDTDWLRLANIPRLAGDN